MNHQSPVCVILAASFLYACSAMAQQKSPPATVAELEEVYSAAIEKRTEDILKLLEVRDKAKLGRVHDIIIAQYRALRARDENINATLQSLPSSAGTNETRETLFRTMSKPLHDQFIAKLSAELTPEQVERIKDKMTYNKLKVTYDAYGVIVPGLNAEDKAKILELLKQAREEAMDGGSADEKSTIFQKYKDQINAYLNAHGHDVAKAYKDFEAKEQAKASNR